MANLDITQVISCISDVISAVYAWPLPEATSTTIVIEFVLPVVWATCRWE